MDPETFSLLSTEGLLPSSYVDQSRDSQRSFHNQIRHLLRQRKIPEEGWREEDIEDVLREMSRMDSNNFKGNAGVGEREARVFSGEKYKTLKMVSLFKPLLL